MIKTLCFVLLFSAVACFGQEVVSATTLLKSVEGSVKNSYNNIDYHVVYDDANPKTKWNNTESFSDFKSRCKGIPTIGYGETNTEVVSKMKITEEEAIKYLNARITTIRKKIQEVVLVKLTSNQETALVSFIYNVGFNAFKTSKLLKKINKGDYNSVKSELKRWIYCNGKKNKGLINRRNIEIDCWNKI